MAPSTASFLLLSLALALSLSLAPTLAQIVQSPFKYVNEGEFGDFVTEYGASYRATPLFTSPFQLMWYNTTPGQYYLGLRVGLVQSESLFRWAWDANRGRPVGENATLTFGTDGNLVLAEADGRVVWQTGTANKGVAGIRILPTGNIVLYNRLGAFVWQSFDHPTDTLFLGQSLYVGGPTKLVSRRSEKDNSDGAYSFVLDTNALNLYAAVGGNRRLVYSSDRFTLSAKLTNVTFEANPDLGTATELSLSVNAGGTNMIVARPKYNGTYSFLRVDVDGNLAVYTFYEPVNYRAWEKTFAFFSTDGDLPVCSLPAKCGSLGVCESEMCVACPTGAGLLGWSSGCAPPKLKACTGASVDYFKVAGVDHFIPSFNKGEGKVTVDECKKRCSADCKCLGIFYNEKTSGCWLAPTLGTLSKVADASKVAYIKYSK